MQKTCLNLETDFDAAYAKNTANCVIFEMHYCDINGDCLRKTATEFKIFATFAVINNRFL